MDLRIVVVLSILIILVAMISLVDRNSQNPYKRL